MSAYRCYDDVAVGDIFPQQPLRFEVSGEAVDGFLAATGNNATHYGGGRNPRRAPSMIAAVYVIELLQARGSPPGGIHARQSLRFHRAPFVGETLTLQARVVEKYRRKERPYVVSDFEARGASGDLVSSGRITSIWGVDP
jgi:hypothetical protein